MVRRVVTDDRHDRCVTATRIVQVGEAVAETRAEVQEHGCRRLTHAGVPVGRACRRTFEEREHTAHLGHRVEGGDKVHL